MSNNGIAIFEVPNVEEKFLYECKRYGEFKWLRAHLSYYSKSTLKKLFEDAGFTNIEIKGVQNYSIENHLHWMNKGEPSLDRMQIYHPDNLEWINKVYKETLEKENSGDAIMIIAEKRRSA